MSHTSRERGNFPVPMRWPYAGSDPPQRVEGFVMPASKNLHTFGHQFVGLKSMRTRILRR
jgi:hypothetical protein